VIDKCAAVILFMIENKTKQIRRNKWMQVNQLCQKYKPAACGLASTHMVSQATSLQKALIQRFPKLSDQVAL
jgi:hypothetical protein